MSAPSARKRTLVGTVVSDKMQKTVTVRVDRLRKHPKYEQRYVVSKKFKAHDEKREFRVGDKVIIEETRPLSKDKRWQVIKKVGQEKVGQSPNSAEIVEKETGAEN